MRIIGTYQKGFTPEENIECKVKIDKSGIEINPLDTSLYSKIDRPKDKAEYELKKFIGHERFPYTWIIEYKDENNKTREILTKIRRNECWKIKWIKKEYLIHDKQIMLVVFSVLFAFVLALLFL